MEEETNLDKLTIEQLEQKLREAKEKKAKIENKGKEYCIVRTRFTGVFAGLFDRSNKGEEGTVFEARRIFYWKGAASLSQMANEGVKCPSECKFTQTVSEHDLRGIIEVTPCTKKAEKNIKAVPVWEM